MAVQNLKVVNKSCSNLSWFRISCRCETDL